MNVSSLDELWAGTGLGPLARQALEYLVSHPDADEDAVAAGIGVSAAAARTALRSLETELLAVHVGEQPTRWSASPPRSSLGALLARKRQELAKAELYAEQLHEVYHSAPGGRSPRTSSRSSRAMNKSAPATRTFCGAVGTRCCISRSRRM